MIETVVFLVTLSPFSKRDYERFGVEILKRNGFNVEVIDCTPFLHPTYMNYVGRNLSYMFIGHNICETEEDILKCIEKLDTNKTFLFYLNSIGTGVKETRLKSFIIKKSIATGFTLATLIPLPFLKNRILYKIKRPETILLILKQVFLKIFNNKRSNFKIDLLIASGTESLKFIREKPLKKLDILWAHSFDYDIYLNENRKVHNDRIQNVAVFVDNDIASHSDYILTGIPAPVKKLNYYTSLKRFFSFIEQKYAVSLTIAAHPRSTYNDSNEYFGNRYMKKGNTAQMVRQAKMVLAHGSTSISYAVLWKKPILFLTTNELERSWMFPQIEVMATSLGKKVINIDTPFEQINWDKELYVNEDKYQEYKERYIKTKNTPELPFWQIVANRLKTWKSA